MKIRLKEIQMNSQWTIANKETKSKTHMSKYPHAYSLSEVVCLCVYVCVCLCVFVWLGKICMFSVSDCGRGHSWIMSCNWSNSACSTCPAVSQEFSSAWISQQLEAVIRKAYKETQCLSSPLLPHWSAIPLRVSSTVAEVQTRLSRAFWVHQQFVPYRLRISYSEDSLSLHLFLWPGGKRKPFDKYALQTALEPVESSEKWSR